MSGSSRRRRSLSLRTLVLSGMALVAIVLVGVAGIITATTRAQLIDQIDNRLSDGAAGDRGGYFERGSREIREHLDRAGAPDASPERQSDFYEGFLDADGVLTTFFVPNVGGEVYAPPDLDGDQVRIGRSGSKFLTVDATEGSVDYRVLALRTSNDGTFVTALPLNAVEATISRLVLIEVIGIAFILAVLSLVTWLMLRLGVRPVKRMTTTASAIAAGDLSVRIDETSAGSEARELAGALNTMLGTLESSLDERTRSEDRLRRFVADASHELRTPLTTIRGYAELYRVGGLVESDALDDAMRRTESEAKRMSRLVEDMLLLAKLDEQRPLERADVDLVELVNDAAADARAASPERSISVEAPDVAVVSGDEDRLRQVFANLITNALLHGGANATVAMRVSSTSETVRVQVADTGDGMPPDVVERVTERFFRVDPSRARTRGGSGLGLAIVEATVTAHGGTVEIESEVGSGTTVTLSLPVEGADASDTFGPTSQPTLG